MDRVVVLHVRKKIGVWCCSRKRKRIDRGSMDDVTVEEVYVGESECSEEAESVSSARGIDDVDGTPGQAHSSDELPASGVSSVPAAASLGSDSDKICKQDAQTSSVKAEGMGAGGATLPPPARNASIAGVCAATDASIDCDRASSSRARDASAVAAGAAAA